MRRLLLSLALLLVPAKALNALAETSPKPQSGIPAHSRQMLMVLTENWKAVPAKIQRYERSGVNQPWTPVGQQIQAVVGRNGMGWGRGLHRHEDTNGDYRVEFDKRAPAGIFSLGEVFGIATETQARSWLGSLKMPYTPITTSMRCIGDHNSSHYNEIVDINKTQSDWRDDDNENMHQIAITDEKAYQWGVFINHNVNANPQPRDNKSGSCIFLHIWKTPDTGTAGCTAMTRENMVSIIRWLDAERQPVLVQLPQAEYQRLKSNWALPEM